MSDVKKSQVVGRIHGVRADYKRAELNSEGRKLPDGHALYAAPLSVDPAAREVLEECLADIEAAILSTSELIGKGGLRVGGVALTASQGAERLAALCLKRRRIMEVLNSEGT